MCILIKNNVDLQVNNIKKDKEGRYIQINGKLNGKLLSLCNVYGPNKDDIQFFIDILEKTDTADTEFNIIGGDFNCILNNEIDKKGGSTRHANKKNQEFINAWITEYDLVDIWRQKHPCLK